MTQHNYAACYLWNKHTRQLEKGIKMETHKELSGAAGEKVVRSAKPLLPTRGDPICLT